MKKIALITGATSGIGKASAQILASNGYDLIITGRREELLNNLSVCISNETEAEVLSLCFDVRDLNQVEKAIGSLTGKWEDIDLLINNAGLAVGLGPVHSGVIDDWERMIDTNVKGLLYISRLISSRMVAKGVGHIINLSSIAGHEAYPNGAAYCASKHAVQAITKAMRIELLPFGVKVSSISPGMVDTEFSIVRFKGDKERADSVYKGLTPLYASDIAEAILFMVTRPKHVNIDEMLIMPTDQASARDYRRQ
ncbi:MAG: SDR family NAD(P)-dependent oxidoreductase [Bacteroidia bacterium]|nr:SDR family NAD(P)-dependent oxidoreductase [Bacteroidia bacterium]